MSKEVSGPRYGFQQNGKGELANEYNGQLGKSFLNNGWFIIIWAISWIELTKTNNAYDPFLVFYLMNCTVLTGQVQNCICRVRTKEYRLRTLGMEYKN